MRSTASRSPRAQTSPLVEGTGGMTLTGEVLHKLRADLIAGRFKPSQKLRLEELRGIYDAGFSPLREALMWLSSDGLVTAEDRRGFRAAPLTLEDLTELTSVRVDIEAMALREALVFGDDSWEGDLVAAFYRLSKVTSIDPETGAIDPEWVKRHHAFHLALINACPNRWVKRFWQVLYDHADRYRRIAAASVPEGRLNEHRHLMDAALARDVERVLDLSAAHIRRTLTLVAPRISAVD